MKKLLLTLMLAGCAVFAWPPIPYAPTVRLSWDMDSYSGVAGYILYWSTNSFYIGTNPVVVPAPGFQSTNTGAATNITLSGLAVGQTYFFVVTAVNTNGFESLPSNEGAVTIPTHPRLRFY